MKLAIQTNLGRQILIWLFDDRLRLLDERLVQVEHDVDQLLQLIQKLLRKHHSDWKELTTIGVVRGPGPFTAVRVGLLITNTFGWLLQIPIIGVRSTKHMSSGQWQELLIEARDNKEIRPFYGRSPNITRSKTRI